MSKTNPKDPDVIYIGVFFREHLFCWRFFLMTARAFDLDAWIYSHYWLPTGVFTVEEFRLFIQDAEKIILAAAKEPWSISVRVGRLDTLGLCLQAEDNNDALAGILSIGRRHQTAQSCTTERKPYDDLVVAILVAAQTRALAAGFSFGLASEGKGEDWRNGCALFESVFQYRIEAYLKQGGSSFGGLIGNAIVYHEDLGYFGAQNKPMLPEEADPITTVKLKESQLSLLLRIMEQAEGLSKAEYLDLRCALDPE